MQVNTYALDAFANNASGWSVTHCLYCAAILAVGRHTTLWRRISADKGERNRSRTDEFRVEVGRLRAAPFEGWHFFARAGETTRVVPQKAKNGPKNKVKLGTFAADKGLKGRCLCAHFKANKNVHFFQNYLLFSFSPNDSKIARTFVGTFSLDSSRRLLQPAAGLLPR